MANTVNDVMNVIASPDYGIKNIAGTTKEILAVLQGDHNSKNNLYNIVDDVKNLLQTLVDNTSSKNKPIEIGDKSVKINQKSIKSILDETKGIRKAIDKLATKIGKQGGNTPTVAKLDSKSSDKVANAMIKAMNKQNKGGGVFAMVDAFKKLKDISLIDIIVGKKKIKRLSEVFKNAKKDLNIKENQLNNIIKLINSAPEMIRALSKVNWRINRIIKNDVIKKLSDLLVGKNSILSISKLLQKNEKVFSNATKTIKNIRDIAGALSKSMWGLIIASMLGDVASKGIKNIETTISKLIPLTKKLAKHKKEISNSSKVAKKITTLVGNLLITSIFLTIAAVTGGPAILGAKLLSKMVNKILPAAKKISKNKNLISGAVGSALVLVAFTGLMAVTSALLATMAVTGLPAILGSILLYGIVQMSIITFKALNKAKKHITKGAGVMLLMSTSLFLFGIALNKISQATKDITWKQFGMIAAITGLFSVTLAALGFTPVSLLILTGAGVMLAMGLSLLPFAKSLEMISKSTKGLSFEQMKLISKSMWALGWGIAKLSILLAPVMIGSITLKAMLKPLSAFSDVLKNIKELGTIPTKLVHQVLNAMSAVGNFFRSNMLRPKAVKNARQYKRLMIPFGNTLKHLNKLKEFGSVPMKLVYQTLDAMSVIANYYNDNPIRRTVIRQAKKYKELLRPFGNTLKYLNKLQEIGFIPMKLVYGALNAMSTIANYYKDNPIRKKAIKQAKKYKEILRPFSQTINRLSKLQEMGFIPMKLVYGALNAMSTIANYYKDNPIRKKTIKQAKRYKNILRPFGNTIKYLSKLNEMGFIPMKLVYGALNAMGTIVNFYQDNKLKILEGTKAKVRATMIAGIISSFGNAVNYFKSLKEVRNVSAEGLNNILNAITSILMFYNSSHFNNEDAIEHKSKFTKYIVDTFINLSMSIQERFANIKRIDFSGAITVSSACRYIISFYTQNKFNISQKKVKRMNDAILLFADTTEYLKLTTQGFTTANETNVKLIVKSMKKIMSFLKSNTLTGRKLKIAQKNISLMNDMTSAITTLSNINQSNLLSVGESISNALSGVSSVDISQMEAVTNMFNAFNGINRSESVLNKFTKSVKEFTTACKGLMDAMGQNTDAINNIDTSNIGGSYTSVVRESNTVGVNGEYNTNQPNGIHIANVDEIARTIAEKINGVLSVDVPDTQVQLLINGTGGNEWTITRY